MNDTKSTEISSVSKARYTAEPPPKPRFRIECVSKCIEHTYARWIHLWIHIRYSTILARYSTIQVMGKIHPAEWGKWVGVLPRPTAAEDAHEYAILLDLPSTMTFREVLGCATQPGRPRFVIVTVCPRVRDGRRK